MKAAHAKIDSLQLANTGLRNDLSENHFPSEEQQLDTKHRLNDLMRHFGKIEKMYNKITSVEQ